MRLSRRLELGLTGFMRKRQHRAALAAVAAKVPSLNPTIVLARVIGNDLWPRHALGQTLRNLAFVLKQEPAFPGTRKLFVMTRIHEPETLAQAEAMVLEAGHDCLTLPFDPAGFAATRLDTSAFGGDAYFMSEGFALKPESRKDIDRLWAAAPKVRLAMDVNGGRNAALEWGQARADWTLVLDGGCFVTAEAFETLRRDLTSRPAVPYVVLPMLRLQRNDDAFVTRPDPDASEEPQLGFSSLARGRFDRTFPYGMRDKTSLLGQIGAPGKWDRWDNLRWLPTLPPLADSHCWKRANAAVFRLSPGIEDGRSDQPGAARKRHQSRNRAILLTLAALDELLNAPDRERARAIFGLPNSPA